MSTASVPQPASLRGWIESRGISKRGWEKWIEKSLFLSAFFSVLITLSIAFVILAGSFEFFTTTDIPEDNDPRGPKGTIVQLSRSEAWARFTYFFTGTEWTESTERYAILPLLCSTLVVTVVAAAVAIPVGLLTAIFLSEYASPRVRSLAKPTLELLAGIPTVVYGFFAITVVTPFLKTYLIPSLGDPNNMLSGGLVVGLMIIPIVASLSEDAFRSVPRPLRDGAIALGANRFETSVKVVLPAALSGVAASFILAISRAIGETMAVTLACGEAARFSLDPRQGAATMTSFIVHRAQGDVAQFSAQFNSLFAVAGVLFFMTLSMNILGQRILRRYRQVYQ